MDRFEVLCPDHFPMKCNLSPADKDYLMTPEKLKAFFIFQYKEQDDWLERVLVRYFNERTWRLFNAGKEQGTGTKFCNICRYALASDFGLVSLTPLNYNVFQEVGLMQGLQKPLLYLLNPTRLERMPFDLDDQIYIEHTNEDSLLKGLDNKMPLLIQKVRLLSGFVSAKRNYIKGKLELLSVPAKEYLRKLVLEGELNFRQVESDELSEWAKKQGLEPKSLNELFEHKFVIRETLSGGTRSVKIAKLNPNYRKELETLLWW